MLDSKKGILIAVLISLALFSFLAWWIHNNKKWFNLQIQVLKKQLEEQSQQVKLLEQQQQQMRNEQAQQTFFHPQQFAWSSPSIPSAAFPAQPLPTQPLPTQPLPTQPLPTQPLPTQPLVPIVVPTETPDELDALLKDELADLLVLADTAASSEPPEKLTHDEKEPVVIEEISTDDAVDGLKKTNV